jgi:hypothetical protein
MGRKATLSEAQEATDLRLITPDRVSPAWPAPPS